MGIKNEGVHTKGRHRDTVKRQMEKWVGREVWQGLQVALGLGEGLEARGKVCKVVRGEINYQGVKQIWRLS